MGITEINILISNIEEKLKNGRDVVNKIQSEWDYINSIDVMKNGYVKTYAKCVDDISTVCSVLNTVSSIPVDCRYLRRYLKETPLPQSAQAQFKARIELLNQDALAIKEGVSYVKSAFDAKVKFYNAVQFMTDSTLHQDLS